MLVVSWGQNRPKMAQLRDTHAVIMACSQIVILARLRTTVLWFGHIDTLPYCAQLQPYTARFAFPSVNIKIYYIRPDSFGLGIKYVREEISYHGEVKQLHCWMNGFSFLVASILQRWAFDCASAHLRLGRRSMVIGCGLRCTCEVRVAYADADMWSMLFGLDAAIRMLLIDHWFLRTLRLVRMLFDLV